MRKISKQLGFSVGTGHRTLLSTKKKRADIAEGTKEGWIMLTLRNCRLPRPTRINLEEP
jgi:hypothetical protein